MTNAKIINRPYLTQQGMNKEMKSNDTFREIGTEVTAWLEAKKQQYAEEIIEEIAKLHDKKNNDYGGAYYEMLNECGTAAGSGIIYNKSRRLANLIKDKTEQMVNDESIEDTLLDLASYAIMTLEHIRGLK
jgi:hypothetical protein